MIRLGPLVFIGLLTCRALSPAQDAPASRAFHVAIGGYLAAAAIDAHLSVTCVNAGRCVEANPVYRPFVASYSAMMTAKLATAGALSYSVWRLRKTHQRVAWFLIAALVSGQCLVDVHNWRQSR